MIGLVVLRIIVFERSEFDFIYILRGGLSFRNNELSGVFVFEATKTKTPTFTAKFDLRLHRKDRTEDNKTD